MDDTIAAISTPPGEGGIAIIRISGPQALEVADAVFQCRQGKPSEFPSHTIHIGTISRNGATLDRVLITVMRSPRTYTGENTAEINCHGGPLVARQILKFCVESGARIAAPGEFTKRAYLNGKMDLTQAEAVMDLITAQTALAQAAATRALEGHLATKARQIRDSLVSVLAQIEADLAFSDEGLAAPGQEALTAELQHILNQIDLLQATAGSGKILRRGVSIAIVGRPNVGKSSLLNCLLGHDRAIVTPIPGTTRDALEASVIIRGILVRLIDTAGIRKITGMTETIAVSRTYKTLDTSDLVIYVVDSSRPFSKVDAELAHTCACKPHLSVLNKIDLPRHTRLPDCFLQQSPIEVSAQTGFGIEALKDKIASAIWSGIPQHIDCDVIINERHSMALSKARVILTTGIDTIRKSSGLDILANEIRRGLDAVSEITGDSHTDDIIDRIFSNFCIGK
jgi:tRNA modification GTPase